MNDPTMSRRSEIMARIGVAAMVLLIFVTVGLIRAVQEWIADRVGSALFGWATVGIIAVAALGALLSVVRRRGRVELRPTLWLIATAAVSVLWAARLWRRPEEAIHLVEYGLLGLLIANALRHRIHDSTLYLSATLVGTLVGVSDELVQWIVPDRFFDFRDVWLNAGAVGLAQIALWKGELARWSPAEVRPGSLRLLCRLAVVTLLLLGLILAGTPARLAGLIDTEEVLVEYGYRHEVPGIGVFKSRFTLAELLRLDLEQGAEAAAIIRQHRRYPEFLAAYPSSRAPFVHEARVHIFSRDRNLALAHENSDDPDRYLHHLGVAYHENQILERFFPQTLRLSGRTLGPFLTNEISAGQMTDDPFTSKVSSHLITMFSDQVAVPVLVFLVVVLIFVDLWLRRRKPSAVPGGES